MDDQQEIQADPNPINNTHGSHTSHEVGSTGPVETPATSSERFDAIQIGLWCSSVFTFIQNELQALWAHLSNDDLAKVKTFVANAISSYTGEESAELGEFLFRNTISVAKELFMPVLEAALSNPSYSEVEMIQLSAEMARLKEQKDIDQLVQAWKDKKAAGHGIGQLNGVPVFGPRRAEDETGITLAPTSYVSLGSIQAMQRLAKREKEMDGN